MWVDAESGWWCDQPALEQGCLHLPSAAWLGRHRERKVGFLKGEGFTRLVGPKNRAMVLTVLTRA